MSQKNDTDLNGSLFHTKFCFSPVFNKKKVRQNSFFGHKQVASSSKQQQRTIDPFFQQWIDVRVGQKWSWKFVSKHTWFLVNPFLTIFNKYP